MALLWRTGLLRFAKSSIGWACIGPSVRFVGLAYLVSVLMYVYNVAGALWLGLQQHYALVASFGVPANVAMLPAGIGHMAVVTTFYPKMCELFGLGKNNQAVRTLDAFVRGLSLGALWTSVLLALYAREILTLIYSRKYASSAAPLQVLAPLVFLLLVQTLLVSTLTALNKPARALLAYAIQIVVLAAVTWLLAAGAASPRAIELRLSAAYVASAVIGTLTLWVPLRRQLSLIVLYRNLIPPLVAILMAAVCGFAVRQLIAPSFVGLAVSGILAAGGYVLVVVGTGARGLGRAWLRA
jgi:O-antigen/teichoic acid export membrane protein